MIPGSVHVPYGNLGDAIKPGDPILLADGTIRLRVLRVEDGDGMGAIGQAIVEYGLDDRLMGHAGDRVGATVFDDTDVIEVRPHRSQRTVLQILHALVEKNRNLRADSAIPPNPSMFNRVLQRVAQTASHDFLVVIISDFDGADEDSIRMVTKIAQHNDVLLIPVFDPSATELLQAGKLVVSSGELQIELDLVQASTRRRITEFTDRRLKTVLAWQEKLGVPVIPVSTEGDSLEQVRHLLGGAARGQRG